MYRISRGENRIEKLEKKSFSELGFREREHLQEWIANQPEVLGEELLIIQKEFSGFDDTQERLDLLALDKTGRLVIIENKLDDSGKDVTWQALKYASYCSQLSKSQIIKIYQEYLNKQDGSISAEESLQEFFDADDVAEIVVNSGLNQRIILVAANFRKEVTSTVLWLLNYNIQLQCFRVSPHAMDDELFLSVEQIIPTVEAEDYMIGMAEKAQQDISSNAQRDVRQSLRRKFWAKFLDKVATTDTDIYQNIGPGVAHWIGSSLGKRGLKINSVISGKYGRVELYIDTGEQDKNKEIFDSLIQEREAIEEAYGAPLEWERLDNKRACRVKAETAGNVFDENEWDTMIDFMSDALVRLTNAFKPFVIKQTSK